MACLLQVEEDMSHNENSHAAKSSKFLGNAQGGKAATSVAAVRKFGTALSTNIQPATSAAAISKSIPPTAVPVPQRPILASCIQNYQPMLHTYTDGITAADVAGAMDIDIADR